MKRKTILIIQPNGYPLYDVGYKRLSENFRLQTKTVFTLTLVGLLVSVEERPPVLSKI